jgi:hypothetical protein
MKEKPSKKLLKTIQKAEEELKSGKLNTFNSVEKVMEELSERSEWNNAKPFIHE